MRSWPKSASPSTACRRSTVKHARKFYKELAQKSGGFHISLDQFAQVTDMVLAVCYKQSSDARLQSYEEEVKRRAGWIAACTRCSTPCCAAPPRPPSSPQPTSRRCRAGRFQVLQVDEDCPIKKMVQDNGLNFKVGRGFYEFTKTETIQGYKEIVLQDRATGDFFEGEKAGEMLGLSAGETARIRPACLEKYRVFVQAPPPTAGSSRATPLPLRGRGLGPQGRGGNAVTMAAAR